MSSAIKIINSLKFMFIRKNGYINYVVNYQKHKLTSNPVIIKILNINFDLINFTVAKQTKMHAVKAPYL